jgi:hypothetical protein
MAGVMKLLEDPDRPPAEVAGAGERPAKPEPALPAIAIVATLLIAIVLLAPWWRGPGYERYLNAAPPGLTTAVRSLPPGTRLLAHRPWGSWFEFAAPDVPVFVDSRIEIVPKDIWEDYGQLAFDGAGWRDVLQRWNVQAIVADADSWDLIPRLEADPDWRVAYRDDDGVLFVRR